MSIKSSEISDLIKQRIERFQSAAEARERRTAIRASADERRRACLL